MLDLVPTDHHGYNTGSYSLTLHHRYFLVMCPYIVAVDPIIYNLLVTREIKGCLSSFDYSLLLTFYSDFTFNSFFPYTWSLFLLISDRIADSGPIKS